MRDQARDRRRVGAGTVLRLGLLVLIGLGAKNATSRTASYGSRSLAVARGR